MTQEYIKIPNDYGGALAGQLLEKIERAMVTEKQQTVIVLVGCQTSYTIGTVIISKPHPSSDESGRIETTYTDEMIQKHLRECLNTDPDHNVNVIIRRLTPERKLNSPAEASNLAFIFKRMLQQPGNITE